MLKHFINSLDGGSFFFTDFTSPSYRPIFTDSAFYKVIYCKSGEACIKVDDTTITLKENGLLFCGPLQSVSLSRTEETQVFATAFNKRFFSLQDERKEQSFFKFLFCNPQKLNTLDLTPEEASDFSAIFNCFLNELNYVDGICQEVLRFSLRQLFIKTNVKLCNGNILSIVQQSPSPTKHGHHGLVKGHFKKENHAAQYVSLLSKSSKTLVDTYKSYGVKTAEEISY